MLRLPLALVLVSAVLPGGAPVRQHDHAAGNTDRLGTVHFATSCTPDAQPAFDRAGGMRGSGDGRRGGAKRQVLTRSLKN